MELRSSAFLPGNHIPDRYTCVGLNVSPPLTWSGVPDEAQSLALIVDDPDAPNGLFTHWVIYDIPFDTIQFPEGKPPNERPTSIGTSGRNDFGNDSYGGPCPPQGANHHYHFRLYALNKRLELPPSATRDQLLDAMSGHDLANAELIGTYGKA